MYRKGWLKKWGLSRFFVVTHLRPQFFSRVSCYFNTRFIEVSFISCIGDFFVRPALKIFRKWRSELFSVILNLYLLFKVFRLSAFGRSSFPLVLVYFLIIMCTLNYVFLGSSNDVFGDHKQNTLINTPHLFVMLRRGSLNTEKKKEGLRD